MIRFLYINQNIESGKIKRNLRIVNVGEKIAVFFRRKPQPEVQWFSNIAISYDKFVP